MKISIIGLNRNCVLKKKFISPKWEYIKGIMYWQRKIIPTIMGLWTSPGRHFSKKNVESKKGHIMLKIIRKKMLYWLAAIKISSIRWLQWLEIYWHNSFKFILHIMSLKFRDLRNSVTTRSKRTHYVLMEKCKHSCLKTKGCAEEPKHNWVDGHEDTRQPTKSGLREQTYKEEWL